MACGTPAKTDLFLHSVLLATHFGTQQNVQEVQMSLLLDLFKFPFIFKGFLSLVDHLVWGRKG